MHEEKNLDYYTEGNPTQADIKNVPYAPKKNLDYYIEENPTQADIKNVAYAPRTKI